MEQIVSIIEQKAHVSRKYTDKNGNAQVFDSMGFILSNGIDTFYAEMTGDMARSAQPYDKNLSHMMQGNMRVNKYTDKEGVERYETKIYITKLV